MKTNKTVTSLLILVALLVMGILYLIFKLETVNEKNYAAEKTISNYQVKNKENENEITEINQKLIKAKKDLSNQTATDKAKMDSLLSDQKTENDELLKKTLTQEQEIFLLEQKLKEIDDKYKKMVCYEPKPKRTTLKKTFKTIPKPISRKKVVMVKPNVYHEPKRDLVPKKQIQNIIINNYVLPAKSKTNIIDLNNKELKAKPKLEKYYPVDGLN